MVIKYEISFYLFTTFLLLSAGIFAGTTTATIPDEPIIPPIPFPQLEKPEKIPLLKLPKNDTGNLIFPGGIPFIPLGSVYVVWQENELLFKMSTDGGKTFAPPVAMSISNNLGDRDPVVISSENTIYIIWMSQAAGGNADIFLKRSIDGGKTFTPEKPINLSNTPDDSGMFGSPSMAVDSKNNLYIVWRDVDDSEINHEIFIKKIGGGDDKTVQRIGKVVPPVTISNLPSEAPSIAIDSSDNIYVVFVETEQATVNMVLKKSTDGGNTFTQSSIVDTSPTTGCCPHIVIDSNNHVYIFWEEENNGGILFKKSTDGGKTFAPEKIINISNIPGSNLYNVEADSNNNLYLVWYGKEVSPAGEILLKKSTDGGKMFGSEIQVKKLVTEIDIPPIIAVDSKNNIFISWNDAHGQIGKAWQILLTKSTDGGKTFTSEKQIHTGTIPYGIPQHIAAR